MLNLKSEDIKLFGQKILDLANIAIASLGFGAILKAEKIENLPWVIFCAVCIYMTLIFCGLAFLNIANMYKERK